MDGCIAVTIGTRFSIIKCCIDQLTLEMRKEQTIPKQPLKNFGSSRNLMLLVAHKPVVGCVLHASSFITAAVLKLNPKGLISKLQRNLEI